MFHFLASCALGQLQRTESKPVILAERNEYKGLVKQEKANKGHLGNPVWVFAGSHFHPGLRGQRGEIGAFRPRCWEEMLYRVRAELRKDDEAGLKD